MISFIKGYENLYAIDTDGNVYSLITNSSRRRKILKPYYKNGYLAVNLYKDGICKHFYIHRLVAKTFLENEKGYKEVNHIDCNKTNNSINNLEWCNRKQNLQHSYENGLKRQGECHGMSKLKIDDIKKIRSQIGNEKQVKIAKTFNVSSSTISAIKTGRLWKGVDNLCQG